jgi:hypothetical protein
MFPQKKEVWETSLTDELHFKLLFIYWHYRMKKEKEVSTVPFVRGDI